MSNPLVSVVMVVCNVERFLAEAIESILGQTFLDFEFVIVDFGSTDNSKGIVSRYMAGDSRVKHYSIPSCGLAEARNASCRLARGQYLAIMDADDVAVSDRLARQVAFMETHAEVSVLGGAVEWIDTTGKALIKWVNPLGDEDIQRALLERCPLWQPTVLMRREAFMLIGGYRAAFAPAEDYDLWLRMAERFHMANLDEVLLRYRIHPYQVSMRKRRQQTLGVLGARVSSSARRSGRSDPLESVNEITPTVLAALGVSRATMQNELARERGKWIRNMCMAGEYSVTLEAALEALRSDLEYVERRHISDLHVIVAWLYWKQKRFLAGCGAVGRAVATRPVVVGRPMKCLLRRFRLWVVSEAKTVVSGRLGVWTKPGLKGTIRADEN
jgi:Glycosyl transferase family 2